MWQGLFARDGRYKVLKFCEGKRREECPCKSCETHLKKLAMIQNRSFPGMSWKGGKEKKKKKHHIPSPDQIEQALRYLYEAFHIIMASLKNYQDKPLTIVDKLLSKQQDKLVSNKLFMVKHCTSDQPNWLHQEYQCGSAGYSFWFPLLNVLIMLSSYILPERRKIEVSHVEIHQGKDNVDK